MHAIRAPSLSIFAAAVCLALAGVAGGAPPIESSPQTFTYQQGAAMTTGGHIYYGTQDTAMTTGDTTDPNRGQAAALGVDGSVSGQDFVDQEQSLLKFGDIFGDGPGQIPNNTPSSRLEAATLSYTVTNSGDPYVRFVRMVADCDESTWAMSDEIYADTNNQAAIQQDDLDANSSYDWRTTSSPLYGGRHSESKADRSLEAWMDTGDPAANNLGWALLPQYDAGTGFGANGIDIASSEYATMDDRPALSITIQVLPGNANMDELVDGQDFSILKAYFGGPGGWARGDFNNDGLVDGQDFTFLKAFFGDSDPEPTTGEAVPEPGTMFLLFGGAAFLALKRRQR